MRERTGLRSLHLRLPRQQDSRPRLPDEVAAWIRDSRRPFGGDCVASLVPEVFEAYARVLHPAWSADQAPVRWGAVATWSGREAHRLAQWDQLSAPDGQRPAPPPFGAPPDTGGLPRPALVELVSVLGRHTTTPDAVFIGVWDGYGRGPEQCAGPDVLDLQERSYLIRSGPLADTLEIGWSVSDGVPLHPEPPTVVWPADRAWFVAGDVDLDSTYLGGSGALVQDLSEAVGLEAWPVEPGDGISAGSDTVTRPGMPDVGSVHDPIRRV
jgi:hypothetical protein